MFLGDVPEAMRAEIEAELDRVHQFYTERFETVPAEFSIFVGTDAETVAQRRLRTFGHEHRGDCSVGWDHRGSARGVVWDVVIVEATVCDRTTDMFERHYFSRVRDRLAPWPEVPYGHDRRGPFWLVRGTEDHTEYAYRAVAGAGALEQTRSEQISRASRTAALLESLQTSADADAAGYWEAHALAFLAAGRLAALAGEPALFEYYAALPDAADWREAFEAAFGLSADAFYADFEAYRASVAPPFPHLTDDRDGPALVFVGEVPDALRAEIEAKLDRVHRFYTERYETVPPADFSIFVGIDVDSVAEQHRLVFGNEPGEGFCGIRGRDVAIVAAIACDDHLGLFERHYFERVRDRLAPWGSLPEVPDGHDSHGPFWLVRGTRDYTHHAYRAAGFAPLPQNDQISRAGRTAAPLSSLQTHSDADAAGHWEARALGFLAAERLAARAGEPALFEYYAALPDAADWREAFEAAFGLSVEAFYADFEAYRARVAPPLPHLTDDREGPALVFLDDVPDDIRGRIEADLDSVHRFYTERFKTIPADFSIFVGIGEESVAEQYRLVYGHEPGEEFCSIGSGDVVFAVVDTGCGHTRYEGVYFDRVLDLLTPPGSLPEVPGGHDRRGPFWLVRGTTDYTHYAYNDATGEATLEQALNEHASRASRTAAPLSSLQTHADAEGASHWDFRALGFLAAERLVALAGEPALFEYYAALPDAADWREAFERAFGIAPDAFYAEFETYRAETIARIVPHQFDHREGPALVFLGDVPDDIRSRMEAKLDRVHRFYTERFETIPADISIFVGTDAESVAEQYRLVWGHEPHRGFCSIGGGGAVFVVVAAACHDPLDQFERPYFSRVLDLLAPGGSLPEVPDGHDPRGPFWLVLGTNDYTYYAYRVLAGADTLERVRNEQISLASRTATPLPSLQTLADAEEASHWDFRALGFLAAERLVERAGEPALFEYYAALRDAADWREAFETAFGLSADAFYADFEAYRARVAPPADGAP